MPHCRGARTTTSSRLYRFEDKHAELKARIRTIFKRDRGRYGYRRVTAELRQQGVVINHKTVQRLMIAMQLKSTVRPKRYRAFNGATSETAPNRLERDFNAERPNEKWVTDVTEFKIENRKLYLSPVMDLYNREIVSYEIAEHPLPKMIESMLPTGSISTSGRFCIPTRAGSTGCLRSASDCNDADSCRACPARGTAWTMLRWKASSAR